MQSHNSYHNFETLSDHLISILFVELAQSASLDDKLRNKINKAIAEGLSRRHVPALLMACPKIPMTSNGKRQEIAVKKILNGARIEQVNADPETLRWFLEQPELQLPGRAKL